MKRSANLTFSSMFANTIFPSTLFSLNYQAIFLFLLPEVEEKEGLTNLSAVWFKGLIGYCMDL